MREVAAWGRAERLAGRPSLADCLALAQSLVRRLVGVDVVGVASRGAASRDDVDLGRVAESWLGDRSSWGAVRSWDVVEEGLERAGPGSLSVVLLRRPGREVGHVFVAYHGVDGVVRWLDPVRGDGESVFTRADRPDLLEAPAGARVLTVGSDGVVLAPELGGAGVVESGSVALALTDAP
ncbi:toxin glutamine deamidase domain-containing protein, partial [Phytohabitans kaempferiae]